MKTHCLIRLLIMAGMSCLVPATPGIAGTVACYRFENARADQPFGSATGPLVIDSSGHGFNLVPLGNPVASAQVPADPVPQTRDKNNLSIHFSDTEAVYAPPGSGLNKIVFTGFTIEAWVCFDRLDGWQTLVGRDDAGSPGEGTGLQSLFYLSKTTDLKPGPGQKENALRVELVTRDNRILVIESTLGVIARTWYHVAVVGDAKAGTLTLYVEGTKIASADGFNGLFVPAKNTSWTLGRGQYKGKPMDYFTGCLDEVRFSDEALSPDQFLNATRSGRP